MKESKELAIIEKPKKEKARRKARPKKKIRKTCQYCKKEFIASRKDRKFCSVECSRAGKKHG